MAASGSGASRKAAKDLACADCQRRKKRCDKQSPCSNCIKHNVPCIPSSPAPPRKRRQPMKELLERLAACEERLKHCNCHQSQPLLPPLQRPHSHEHSSHNGAPPSPPASAASRDAAIANMLDHSEDGEKFIQGHQQHHGSAAMTAPAETPATTTPTTAIATGKYFGYVHHTSGPAMGTAGGVRTAGA